MKHRLIAILTAALMICSALAGCVNGGGPSEPTEIPADAKYSGPFSETDGTYGGGDAHVFVGEELGGTVLGFEAFGMAGEQLLFVGAE